MFDEEKAWGLACGTHFEWDEDERELLAPLVDATIMRVDSDRLDAIARPIVVALWEGLRPLLETECDDPAVAADLAAGPEASRLALAVVEQAAMDLADHAFFLEDCLDCIDEGLEHAPPVQRPELVARAAAALALHGEAGFGIERPGDEERAAARAHVRAMAELGRDSLPRLAPALSDLAAEPLPPFGDDAVLRAVVKRRLAASAHLN